MPTAGDYEVEFVWYGRTPDGEHQESVWWDRGSVCYLTLGDVSVDIYVDGDTYIKDNLTHSFYSSSSEFPQDLSTDKELSEATLSQRLDWVNNSWFDLYANGEHLDDVQHEADEAFESACNYLIGEFVNLCRIENNQEPQVEGKRVVVFNFEDE
jgi:hypothetical protein